MNVGARLTAAAEEQLRRFFAGRGERFPPEPRFHGGLMARCVTLLCGATAVTLGRHVMVDRRAIVRTPGGWTLDGPLVVHECVHVRQYEEHGPVRFLLLYVRHYLAGLVRYRRWGLGARHAAYRAIPFEREAAEAERAYSACVGDGRARCVMLEPSGRAGVLRSRPDGPR